MARSASALEEPSFGDSFWGVVGSQFRSLQKMHLVLKIFGESSKAQLRCQEGYHSVSFQLSFKSFTGDEERSLWKRSWGGGVSDGNTPPKFKIQHERPGAGAVLVFIFPHKPARIGALQPTCCLWWPWSAFWRALVGSTDPFPGNGESHTAITPALKCSPLLCFHKSHSYLVMNLALRTGTAPQR